MSRSKVQLLNRSDRFGAIVAPQRWRHARHTRFGMSEAHLALIRKLPCIICGVMHDTHAYHLRSDTVRTRNKKAADRYAVPVCSQDYDAARRVASKHERAWFVGASGIDAYILADALWAASGDASRLYRVIFAHQLAATRDLLVRSGK